MFDMLHILYSTTTLMLPFLLLDQNQMPGSIL